MVLQLLAILFLSNAIVLGECDSSHIKRQKSKMINISLSNILFDIDPVKAWNYQHFLVLQAISETLVKVDENGRFVSGIAKTWKTSNGGKKVSFTIDEKAVFHDGTKVKSIDVADSISRHFRTNSKSVVVSYLRDVLRIKKKNITEDEIIDSIKIIDDKHLDFNLIGPYSPILSVLSMPGFSIFKAGEKFEVNKDIIGSGAYRIKIEKNKANLLLERFEDYFQLLPDTKVFCIKQHDTMSEIYSEFKNHRLDLAFGVPIKDIDLKTNTDLKLVKTNTIVSLHAYVNPRGDLKDVRIRKIIKDLIQIFNNSNHNELHTPTSTYIPEGFLPRDYYLRTKPILQKVVLKKQIRMFFHDNYFSSEYVKKFNDFMKNQGANIMAEALSAGRLYDSLDSKKFDIITIPYMANFPDPDGFIELLSPGQVFKKNHPSVLKFKENISKVRFIDDVQLRLRNYSKVFNSFEDEALVIPMSKITLPLIHAHGVVLPDTSYKYEADLRRIFWDITK